MFDTILMFVWEPHLYESCTYAAETQLLLSALFYLQCKVGCKTMKIRFCVHTILIAYVDRTLCRGDLTEFYMKREPACLHCQELLNF
jgi:hypothetical protein